MTGRGNGQSNNHRNDGVIPGRTDRAADSWSELSAPRTLPLLSIVQAIDSTMTAAKLPGAVRDVLGVLEARNVYGSLRHAIDLKEEAPLFGGPELRFATENDRTEFNAAWRFATGCAAVTQRDVEKLLFLSRQVDRGAKLTADERPILESIKEQITHRGIGRGFLTDPERSLLNDFWNFRAEFLEAERRQKFSDLGLEWREKNSRLEPAKIGSRFTQATFCSLSSRYFTELLTNLSASSSDATADQRARHDELRRIYRKAQHLSESRERGNPEASRQGWDEFLKNDLYPRYGVGSSSVPF